MANQYVLFELGFENKFPAGHRSFVPAICDLGDQNFSEAEISGNDSDAVQEVIDILLEDEDFKDYHMAYTDTSVVLKHKIHKVDIAINLTNIIDENKATELEELLGITVYQSDQ